MTRVRTTVLVSLSVFALGAVVIAVGAVNQAPGPGVGPFLLLLGLVGLYASLCMAVGKVVLPCQSDACFVVTQDRFDELRGAPRAADSPDRAGPRL